MRPLHEIVESVAQAVGIFPWKWGRKIRKRRLDRRGGAAPFEPPRRGSVEHIVKDDAADPVVLKEEQDCRAQVAGAGIGAAPEKVLLCRGI